MYKVLLAVLFMMMSQVALAEETRIIDAIEARQSYYRILEFNIGSLGSMAKEDLPYDPAQAKIYAGNLKVMSNYSTASLYPSGTSQEDFPGHTRALAKIWKDFPGVHQKEKAFLEAVQSLNDTIGEGQKALGASVQQLGGTCARCHKDYVAKDFLGT